MTELAALLFILTCAPFLLLALSLTCGGKFVLSLISMVFIGLPSDGLMYLLKSLSVSALNAAQTFIDVSHYIWIEANTYPVLSLVFSAFSVYLHFRLMKKQSEFPLAMPSTGLIDDVIDFFVPYILTSSFVIGVSILFFGGLSAIIGVVGAIRLAFVESEGTIVTLAIWLVLIAALFGFRFLLNKRDKNIYQMLRDTNKTNDG